MKILSYVRTDEYLLTSHYDSNCKFVDIQNGVEHTKAGTSKIFSTYKNIEVK
ncbi:hypothetical protein [Flavobacterium sp. PL02]|uniref:hypothetical protein n=1 Tax=Flavobacterium sp. PL02 TaxID=3088354 RepID=UPI002B222351|nr:hypothetical protein [Flavobacterium sp. PL02]MEA9414466.1 hypothetical protein [Flavobacterium sp. PL02]